jgi:hypothetical protein
MAIVRDYNRTERPRQTSGSPSPEEERPEAAPPMESGVLPGEEQVTTMGTFASMSPQDQAALRARHKGQPVSFEDWASETWSELPPAERIAAMQAAARTAPQMRVGTVPGAATPGENTPLANPKQHPGRPLPEGRAPKQYEDATVLHRGVLSPQAPLMQNNADSPEIPMKRFQGTYAYDPSGKQYYRAPNMDLMEQAQAIANDPEQGKDSDSYWIALAEAFGLDTQQYGDDLDLLRNHVWLEQQRHEPLAEQYDIETLPDGARVYVPNAALREKRNAYDRKVKVDRMLERRHWEKPEITDERYERMIAAERSPTGMDDLRSVARDIRRDNLRRRGANVMAMRENINLTRTLNDPNMAPGVLIRELRNQVAAGNPLGMSMVYNIAGMPGAARDAASLEMGRAANAAMLGRTEMEMAAAVDAANAAGQPQGDAALPDLLQQQVQAALKSPADVGEAGVVSVLAKMQQYQGADPAALRTEARRLIASAAAAANPQAALQDARVVAHLRSLASNQPAFIEFALSHGLAANQEEAKAMHGQYARTWGDAGRDAAAAARGLVDGVRRFAAGLAGGGEQE